MCCMACLLKFVREHLLNISRKERRWITAAHQSFKRHRRADSRQYAAAENRLRRASCMSPTSALLNEGVEGGFREGHKLRGMLSHITPGKRTKRVAIPPLLTLYTRK